MKKYNKTTHIVIDEKPSDVDVLFGLKNIVEHVYPSATKHPVKGKLTYQKINENVIGHMSEKLKLFLEPKLNPKSDSKFKGKLGVLSTPLEAPTALIKKLLLQLSAFGYKDPAFVRMSTNGFDFTYDHSLPDPLDPSVTHDTIDGYVIINTDDNSAIVGTYSDKGKRKNAFLCPLEEPEFEAFDSEPPAGIATITYSERYVRPFQDVHPAISGKVHKVTLCKSDMGTGKSGTS